MVVKCIDLALALVLVLVGVRLEPSTGQQSTGGVAVVVHTVMEWVAWAALESS